MIKPTQDSLSAKPYIVILVILLLAWFFVAKLLINSYVDWQADEAFEQVKKKTHESISEFQSGFDKMLGVLHAVPAILSRDVEIGNALKKANATLLGNRLSTADYRKTYEHDPAFSKINRSLSMSAKEIRIINVIWIIGREGRTILSSNAQTLESYVGNDLSLRRYFKMAMEGKAGVQYSVGSQTGSQGIYFSSPVYETNRVIGVVAGKVALKDLANLVRRANGFLIDEFGVIVEAKNPAFVMMAMPDATVLSLPEAERLARYKRKDFVTLPISPWRKELGEQFVSLGESEFPYYVESVELLQNRLKLMIAEEAAFPAAIMANGTLVFFLLLIGGWLGILIVTGVVYQIRSRRVAAFNRKRQEVLEHIATHDVLTGVYSRVVTESMLEKAISHAGETHTRFALLFIDLDFFKEVNDTYGHAVGDEVLKEIGLRLQASVRKSDVIIRYGGDEFLILLDHIRTVENVGSVATHILDAVQQVMVVQEAAINLSASIGIAIYPDDGRTLMELLQHADKALYHVKDADRAHFAFYSSVTRAESIFP
ncbi:MAG: diguanylate cyclase [Oxalobacter sp.]|nr:diguanylate cyclase [Oxalobacter sp.]